MSDKRYVIWFKCANCKTKFPYYQDYEKAVNVKLTKCTYCGVEGENEKLGSRNDLDENKFNGKKLLND